jgi:hypothetical protein
MTNNQYIQVQLRIKGLRLADETESGWYVIVYADQTDTSTVKVWVTDI